MSKIRVGPDGRTVFVPEGQHDRSRARGAWHRPIRVSEAMQASNAAGGGVTQCDSMKIFLLPILTGLMSVATFAANNLASYEWKSRVLVVLAPSETDGQLKKQQSIVAEAATGFSERDLTVVTEIRVEGPLHRQFAAKGSDFQVLLIGKDGQTALRRSKAITAEELFEIIDAMPMRRDEVRRRKES